MDLSDPGCNVCISVSKVLRLVHALSKTLHVSSEHKCILNKFKMSFFFFFQFKPHTDYGTTWISNAKSKWHFRPLHQQLLESKVSFLQQYMLSCCRSFKSQTWYIQAILVCFMLKWKKVKFLTCKTCTFTRTILKSRPLKSILQQLLSAPYSRLGHSAQ